MGLDSVELVMAAEESFGIAIPDQEASKIRTVDDFYQCILRKIDLEETNLERQAQVSCLSSAAFYRLRRAFIQAFGVSRSSVRPSSRIDEYFPIESRRSDWTCLSEALDLTLPGLVRPEWLNMTLLIMTIAGSLIGTFVLFNGYPGPALIASMLFLLCTLAFLSLQLSRPYRRQFAQDCQTVRELTQALLRMNYPKLAKSNCAIDRDEVWSILKAIIVHQLCVRPEDVVPSALLVEDLGVD